VGLLLFVVAARSRQRSASVGGPSVRSCASGPAWPGPA